MRATASPSTAVERTDVARRPRARTLRFRLTAVATAAVAVVLTLTAVALLTVQRGQLTATLDASLDRRADTVTAGLDELSPGEPIATDAEDSAVQVVGPGGEVLVASTNLVGAPDIATFGRLDDRRRFWTTDRLPIEDDTYRVMSRDIDTAAGPAVLHVAENSDDLNEAIADLAVALTATVPTVSLLLAGVIWWLTGRTLAPVEAIRAQVAAISTTDSAERIDVEQRDDEITRLAATMNDMLDRLRDASERQRRFVADAAHELRTPITRVRTNVEVDLARPDRADAAATLRAVREEAVGLQDLLDDLLHLARHDAGHGSGRRRPIDLDDIVLDEIARQRNVSDVSIDAHRVSAAHLWADPDHMARAARNVLANAVRHATSSVTVALTEQRGRIELTVTDDGGGVPDEDRHRIFERFARVDDARARHDGGTGLGLAITREIVEDHGGSITCDAGVGTGARFVITLPADPETPSAP